MFSKEIWQLSRNTIETTSERNVKDGLEHKMGGWSGLNWVGKSACPNQRTGSNLERFLDFINPNAGAHANIKAFFTAWRSRIVPK